MRFLKDGLECLFLFPDFMLESALSDDKEIHQYDNGHKKSDQQNNRHSVTVDNHL
ncbi:hypothetical protein D1872_303550 [compost metagenome]